MYLYIYFVTTSFTDILTRRTLQLEEAILSYVGHIACRVYKFRETGSYGENRWQNR